MQNYTNKLIMIRKQNKMADLLFVHLMVKLKKFKIEKIANVI